MKVLTIHSDAKIAHMMNFTLENQFFAQVKNCIDYKEAISQLLSEEIFDLVIIESQHLKLPLVKQLSSPDFKIPAIIIDESENSKAYGDIQVIGIADPAAVCADIEKVIKKTISMGLLNISDSSEDSPYCPIKADLIVHVTPLAGDIYIRLSKTKYVMLFRKGVAFGLKDLDKYLTNKGVKDLYLKKEDIPGFTQKFNDYLSKVVASKQLDQAQSLKFVASSQEAVLELYKTQGFTPEVKEMAKKNVQIVEDSVKKTESLTSLFEVFQKEPDKYISSHSLLLSHVSCYLSKKMDWPSHITFSKLGFASLFHDITLKNHSLAAIKNLKELEKYKQLFRDDEIERYKKHPSEAAEMVRQISDLPPDVEVIILQHHERPDGSGFPKKMVGLHIFPLAALFIIAHDIVDHFFNSSEEFNIKKFFELKAADYDKGPFKSIVKKAMLGETPS